MPDDLLRFNGARERDPSIHTWIDAQTAPLRALVEEWFHALRHIGPEVVELFHDGCPVVCLADAPFAYINAFTAHVNVGFYRGAELPDPAHLLEGSGKRMRHVKLRAGTPINERALHQLIEAAYADMQTRLK